MGRPVMPRGEHRVGSKALVLLIFASVVAVGLVIAFVRSIEEPVGGEPAASGDRGSAELGGSQGTERRSNRPQIIKRGVVPERRPQAEVPERQPEEELWSMIPDRYALEEIEQWDFEIQGGLESPGTDPVGARHEVDDPEWPEVFSRELEGGLREMVLTEGVELHRIECARGRCLVELGYDGMERAFERVEALRRWLNERVRCRAYSDGPYEGDAPSVMPTQPIWILCGEPESSPFRE